MEDIHSTETIRRNSITENMAYHTGQGSKAYKLLVEIATFQMAVTEGMNRKTALLAGYRLSRRAGMDDAFARREAVEFNLDVNGDYSRRGKAAIDEINLAKPLLSLQSYVRLYLTNMKNSVVEGDMLAIGAHLAITFTLAGAAGLPFFNVADDWWKKEQGESLMTGLRRWLKENGFSPKWASGLVGITTGVDIGPNLSLFIPSKVEDLFGMAGRVSQQTSDFIGELKYGDEGRLLETFPAMPFIAHDVFRYLREREEGKTSRRGKRDEFAPPTSWIGLLGGRTVEQRTYQEAQQTLFASKTKARTDKETLLTRLARAYATGDDARFDEIIEEIIKYDEEVVEEHPDRVITGEMIKNSLLPRRIDKKLLGEFLENIELE